MCRRTHIAYELPSTVKPLDDSWQATYQISITVIGLFMGVEVPLLFFFKNESSFSRSGVSARQALVVMAYSSLFLSLSAAVSGLILTDKLRKISMQTPQEASSDRETLASLCAYQGRLIWVARHWALSLVGSVFLQIVQVFLYVWLEESNAARFTLFIITLFAVLPLVFVLLPSRNLR